MNALELFAGGGGAAVGLRLAGFTATECVDGERAAVATLRAAGLPGVWGWIGGGNPDVPEWVPELATVDMGWASPPCQPWSRAAIDPMGAADPRDGWSATRHVVEYVAPAWMVIENVRDAPIAEWCADLTALGYITTAAFLDAADWGLPSHRNRWYIVAGPKGFRWPSPTHAGPDVPPLVRGNRLPWVGFGSVLWPGGSASLPGEVEYDPENYPGAKSRPDLLHLPSAGVMCTEVKGTRANPGNAWRFNGGPDRASDSAYLATGRRRLTPAECAALVGMSGHPWQGNKGEIYHQIGNVVAPVMAEAIGGAILDQS